jgi:A/G-specific adenine glycosylase
MLKAAKIVQDKYAGVFPKHYPELVSLPWIGPYTAQAILAFWYGKNILAFDTNIEKIFARYYFGSRFTKLSKEFKKEIQKQFEKTKISWRDINAALMDFSSLIDINEKNNIDWNNYPLSNSKFFQEKWQNEHKPEKSSIKINKKDAEIIVFPHQDHKEYYSSDPDNFKPFVLGKSSLDHRHYIKDYFKENFWLSLSVRPAYKKIASQEGNFFFYHAQIQAGEHNFWIFEKSEKEAWEERINNIPNSQIPIQWELF